MPTTVRSMDVARCLTRSVSLSQYTQTSPAKKSTIVLRERGHAAVPLDEEREHQQPEREWHEVRPLALVGDVIAHSVHGGKTRSS